MPRSGTTFLTAAIARSPEVSELEGIGPVADEGQYVQRVYATQNEAGGIARFAYSPDIHLTESSPLATAASRDALWKAWSPYWNLDAPVLLEKTPSNLLKMRFLQELFPGSHFIVIVRHPIAQAMAVKGRGWANAPVSKLVDHWLAAHDLMMEDLSSIHRLAVLRYEDLVRNADVMLDQIQRFLGLEPVNLGQETDSAINDRYFQQWQSGGVRAGWDRTRTLRKYEARLARYGYSFSSPLPVAPLSGEFPGLPD